MTDDELRDAMSRMAQKWQAPDPLPMEQVWHEVKASRATERGRRRLRLIIASTFGVAASLFLIMEGARAIRSRTDGANGRGPAVVQNIVARHLARSDSVIRAFQSVVGGQWDDRLAGQARDLELATRRIQGGRMAKDSTTVGLLADVDFVLTEIVGYGDLATGRIAESEMIEYSIQVRHIATRLDRLGMRSTRPRAIGEAIERVGARARAFGAGALGVGIEFLAPMAARAATPDGDRTADSLYRAGREALARRDYHGAADLFASILSRYPAAAVVGNVQYWRAYSLYASGNISHDLSDFRGALDALYVEEHRYAGASTAQEGLDLRARVIVAEAMLGDARATSTLEGAVAALAAPLSCDDGDLALKLVALERLIDRDPEDAMPTIRRVLSTQGLCTEDVRRRTIVVVANTPGMNATQVIDDLARADRSLKVVPGALSLDHEDVVDPQAPAVHPVGAIVAKTTEPLGTLGGIHVLSDGRVVLNDQGGPRGPYGDRLSGGPGRVLLFDPTLSSFSVLLDTSGASARRYPDIPGPPVLIPFAGDSTAFYDPRPMAVVLLDPNGRIARVMAAPFPPDAGYLGTWPGARFDPAERAIYRASISPGSRPTPIAYRPDGADSAPIVRATVGAVAPETLAYIRVPSHFRTEPFTTREGAVVKRGLTDPFVLVDAWAMLSDGTVAIVRGHDYHIDWVAPDGQRTSSPKLPFQWHRLSDSEKVVIIDSVKAYNDAHEGFYTQASAAGKFTGTYPAGVIPVDSLADYRPPFAANAMLADADGNVWLLPTPEVPLSPNPGPVYDVVNRAGQLIDRVQLTPGFGIVGFSPGYVFMSIREGATTVLVKAKIR